MNTDMAGPAEKAVDQFRVMVCVDESKNAEVAFQYYIDNLHKPELEVIIGYVVPLYMPLPEMYAVGIGGATIGIGPSPSVLQDFVDTQSKIKEKLKKKYEAKCKKANVKHHFLALYESVSGVGATLVEALEKHKVDMVVLGSRGMGVIRRTFIGSVSDYVLHHSRIPTVICPKHE